MVFAADISSAHFPWDSIFPSQFAMGIYTTLSTGGGQKGSDNASSKLRLFL